VIAVDGPAASGKSTIARRLATALRLEFLDTGLLYRAVGRKLMADGGAPDDEQAAVAAALSLEPADVDERLLRGEEVGQAASKVAAIEAVRSALLPFQRRFATRDRGAVLAGRDVGTVVCPDAPIKLFVTASAEERARRRYDELRRGGSAPIYAEVLDAMLERDRRDADREVAPLRVAHDAWMLDTTALDADAAFTAALDHIRHRLAQGLEPARV
jgi:cytidylate kinase